jgi:[acyl-carrier-protein] S-malonyltransferase
MTLAILCSGQGLQHPRMFSLTGDAPAAASVFAHAAHWLGGRDPHRLVQRAKLMDAAGAPAP